VAVAVRVVVVDEMVVLVIVGETISLIDMDVIVVIFVTIEVCSLEAPL
jgi:hypothetical protein